MTNVRKYLFEIISFPLLLLITLAVSLYLKTPNDDAFIFLVYIKNLLAGNGLTYNGTVVEGFSSPLWVALISLLGLSKINLVVISQAASLVFALGCVVLTYIYSRRLNLNKWMSLVPPFFLALSGDLGVYALSGLETFCFVFFVLLSLIIYTGIQDNNYFKSLSLPVILAVTSWVRPEGMMLSAVFFLGILLKGLATATGSRSIETKNIRRFISLFVIIILPLFILRYIYYGELLPNTYYAKANAGFVNLPLGIDYLKYILSNYSFLSAYILPVLLLCFFFNWRKLFTEYALIFAWILYITIIGGDNMIGGRVLLPIFPIVYVLIAYAFNDLFERIQPLKTLTVTMRNCMIILPGFLMCIYVFYNYTHQDIFISYSKDLKKYAINREKTGRYLKYNFPENTLTAVVAAGMVPYYSGLPTIDMLGLNDHHIAHDGKRDRSLVFAHQAHDFEYVLSKKPAVIILGFVRKVLSFETNELLNKPAFRRDYHSLTIPGIVQVKGTTSAYRVFAANEYKGKYTKKTPPQHEGADQLLSLPGLSFDKTKTGSQRSGVVKHDPSSAYEGYNLYLRSESNEAYLMDMGGKIVHTWTWPPSRINMSETVEMLDNGDLLFACPYCGLLKIDWNSNLIFRNMRIEPHNDINVLPDRTLLVLARSFHKYRGKKINFDKILHVTEDGKPISSWSTFDNLKHLKKLHLPSLFDTEEKITKYTREKYKYFLLAKFNQEKMSFLDYYHANAVEVLPETQLGKNDRTFQEGNRLVCFRDADLITIIDKETGKIVWSWGPGKISLPHTPTMLDSGNILIFDSQGNGGYSRVIELDPISKEIVWEYKGDPPEKFFSRQKGSAQRLPNGNTLITDSDHGRVLEVTREGRTVWEWLNPETDIEDQLRKSVYRMRRLNKDAVEKLF